MANKARKLLGRADELFEHYPDAILLRHDGRLLVVGGQWYDQLYRHYALYGDTFEVTVPPADVAFGVQAIEQPEGPPFAAFYQASGGRGRSVFALPADVAVW